MLKIKIIQNAPYEPSQKCPNGKNCNVGSYCCKICEHYEGIEWRTIYCKYDERNKNDRENK